jgi:hypothetical protein
VSLTRQFDSSDLPLPVTTAMLDVSSGTGAGGTVAITGRNVLVDDVYAVPTIDASGAGKAGTIDIEATSAIAIGAKAGLVANAGSTVGDGGSVRVVAGDTLRAYGSLAGARRQRGRQWRHHRNLGAALRPVGRARRCIGAGGRRGHLADRPLRRHHRAWQRGELAAHQPLRSAGQLDRSGRRHQRGARQGHQRDHHHRHRRHEPGNINFDSGVVVERTSGTTRSRSGSMPTTASARTRRRAPAFPAARSCRRSSGRPPGRSTWSSTPRAWAAASATASCTAGRS